MRDVNTDLCGPINTFLHKHELFLLVLLVCAQIQPVPGALAPGGEFL